MQRSIVVCDGKAYRPAGFREPNPGEFYLASSGVVKYLARKRGKTVPLGRRTILLMLVNLFLLPEEGSGEDL